MNGPLLPRGVQLTPDAARSVLLSNELEAVCFSGELLHSLIRALAQRSRDGYDLPSHERAALREVASWSGRRSESGTPLALVFVLPGSDSNPLSVITERL